MHLQVLLYRFRWFHAPAAVLMMLLQRTPALRLVAGGTVNNFGLQSGDVLKSVFALAALGSYNSVAGATSFNATVVSPTTVTPTSGAASSTFTASGAQNAAFSIAFSVSGAPGSTASWKVMGTLPAGLSVTGGSTITGGYLFNGFTKLIIAGTPTAAGSQTLTVTGYDSTNGSGNKAHITCIINITATTSAPVFTTGPSSQTVNAGSNATFTATATGSPKPTFQWYKDNVALSGQTSTTLSLTNVQSTNAGSYKVVATNSAAPSGISSNTATLTLAQTITFDALSSKTYGDPPFTISATASSGLTPTFSIVSGPATISGSTVTLTGGGTVIVRSDQAGDTTYAAATPVDQSFSVSSVPAFTTQPSTQTVFTGNTVTFTAVTTGMPAPTLQWFKDNAALSGKTSDTLSLSNVQSGDEGAYTVVATNSAAPSGISSNTATLTVNPAPAAPVFTTHPATQTVAIGDNATLTVAVTGTPAPTLQWYKNNAALSGQTGLTLSLTNIQLADAGSYTAKAFNASAPAGVTSSAASLTVQVPPPAMLASRSVHIGERLTLDLAGGATYPAGIVFYASNLPTGFILLSTGQLSGLISGTPRTLAITYWTQSGTTKSVIRTLPLTIQAFPLGFSGKYETLLEDTSPGAIAPLPVGKVELTVTSGAFTGRLTTIDSKAYLLKGSLELNPGLTAGSSYFSVTRTTGLTPAAYQLAVSVSQDGSMNAALYSNAVALGGGTGSKLAGTATLATYTMLVREPINLGFTDVFPRGDGYFSATASSLGILSLKGNLADGTIVTASTAFGADHALRPYIKPYANAAGYLSGTLQLTARSDNPALSHLAVVNGSDFYWVKPILTTTTSYPGGFGPLALKAVMEPWNATPATGFGSRLGLTSDGNFTVTILGDYQSNTGPGDNTALPTTLNLNAANALTVPSANPSAWTLKLTGKTGVFTGTCYPTDKLSTHKAIISGVLFQPAPGDKLIGGGYLLTPPQNASQTKSTSSVEFTVPN